MDPLQLFLIWAAVLFASILRSFTGFGFALAAVPVFSMFLPPAEVVVLTSSLALAISLLSLPSYWGVMNLREMTPLVMTSCLGTMVGAVMLAGLSVAVFQFWVGLSVLLACLGITVSKPSSALKVPGLSWATGLLSGLMNGALAIPGPPMIVYAMLTELVRHGRALHLIHMLGRLIRNLAVNELIIAGDLWDRGPRGDRVMNYLQLQPNVEFIWGNHDVSWMGACLGQETLIALVLRISLRYRRLYQLEEGYGILTKSLEQLAEAAYADDPAEHFRSKREGVRNPLLIARMHKAVAILEFKLQGQLVERHPEWEMDGRNLLKEIDFEKGTVRIGDEVHPLQDTHFPTVDPTDPNRLSPEEQTCLDRIKESFVTSPHLWQHMQWMAERGQMALVRDRAAIFHACLAVDEEGEYLPLTIDGKECRGPEQFEALNRVIKRAFRAGTRATEEDKDWFYYLWAGPRSPLFGKDRMATFETYFVANKDARKEIKNPWFKKIHDFDFCDRLCREMGIESGGLVVNGHVPVRVEQGEVPLKDGGNAVTIDGAFSEAYGDRGYTLILAPEGEVLAEHHAFPDPVSAVRDGRDLVPTRTLLRSYDTPRVIGDTEKGVTLKAKIQALEELVDAYENGDIPERPSRMV